MATETRMTKYPMTSIKEPNRTNACSPWLAFLFVFSIQHAACAIITVTSLADDLGNPSTLRTAVNSAIDGDTIVFADALKGFTITLLNGEMPVGKNLTIIGPPDASITIVGGNLISPLNQRIFHVTDPGVGPDTIRTFQVSGLRMQGSIIAANGANGTAVTPAGGSGANPGGLIEDHGGGGAIYCEANTLLVASNCYFLNCVAKGGNGGDAYNADCSPVAAGGMGGSAGGGAIFSFGDCFLYNCSFYTNTAIGGLGGGGAQGGEGGHGGDGLGGAIAVGYHAGHDLRIINCTFYGNIAFGGDGGVGGTGFFCFSSVPADGGTGGTGGTSRGGAIYDRQTVEPPTGIIHSTVYNNYCYRGGGGGGGTGILEGLNGAIGGVGGAYGGGLIIVASPVRAANNLFAGNRALPTTAIPLGPDVHGTLLSEGHNLVANPANCDGLVLSDLRGTVALPINALLGPFQNNGGFMPTLALLQGSPAIDAGTMSGVPLDEIGQTRAVVASGIVNGGDGSDIGAYEVQCGNVSPRLYIFSNGASVTVKWPAPSFCSKLQSSQDMIIWSDYLGAVAVVGDMHQVFLNGQVSPFFYRLIPR